MRNRFLLGLGLLTVLLAGSAWLLCVARTGDEELVPVVSRAGDEATQDVRLVGRAPTASVPAPSDKASETSSPAVPTAERTLRGRLVAEDLGSVRRARVWLIPKGVPGIRHWNELPARAEVERDGSFQMKGDPRGCWIGGLAAGHLPAFLDGDLWDGEEIEIRLERGRRIDLDVTVDTDGVQPDLAASVCSREEGAYDYPGPGAERDMSTHARLAGAGCSSVYVSMKGKIHVCVGAKGFVSTPRSVHLGPDENRASFRVTLGCRVDVEIRDEETELVLTESVDVIARSVEGGLDHDVYRNPGDFAEAMEWIGLLPGAYRIEVISDDYQDWTSDVVQLSRPGERVEVVARLRPETGRGRLLLKLKPPPGGTLKGAEVSVLIGRKDDEGLLAWARVALHGRSEDRTSHLLPPMMPGDLHLLAWGGRVAVGRLVDFALQPDRTHEVSLQLQPGVLVRLVPPPQRSGAFVLGTAHVQLTAPDGTRLPVAWFRSRLPPLPGQRWWLMSNHEYRDELVSFGDAPRTDAVLGPYPVPQVAAEGHSAELVPNE